MKIQKKVQTLCLFCADMACEGHWHTLLMFTTVSDSQLNPRFTFTLYQVSALTQQQSSQEEPETHLHWPLLLISEFRFFHTLDPPTCSLYFSTFTCLLNFLFWCWPWTLFFPFYCYLFFFSCIHSFISVGL